MTNLRLIVDFIQERGTELSSVKYRKMPEKGISDCLQRELLLVMRTVRRRRRSRIHSLNHKQKMTDKLRKWQLWRRWQNKSSGCREKATPAVREKQENSRWPLVKERIQTAAKMTEIRDLGTG